MKEKKKEGKKEGKKEKISPNAAYTFIFLHFFLSLIPLNISLDLDVRYSCSPKVTAHKTQIILIY